MKNKNKSMIILFLTPAIIAYLIMFLYPTLRTFFMSFFKVATLTQGLSEWQFNGITNYINMFNDELFQKSIQNSIKIWLIGGTFSLTIALLIALIINSGIKGKSFFRAVIYLPNTISAIAMGTMWMQYVFSAKYGLFKDIFTFLRLDTLAEIAWTSPKYIFMSMLIAYCFGIIGYHMLIFIAGLDSIPEELHEAATVDGANKWNTFTRITLPLLKGTIKTNIILWTLSTAGFFVWSRIFSPINLDIEVITPMVYMYTKAFGANIHASIIDVGIGAAVGIVLVCMILVSFVLCNLLIKDDT